MVSTDNCFDISELDYCNSININSYYDYDDYDSGNYPDIPITYKELKEQLENGLINDSRVIWWPILPQINNYEIISNIPNIKENSIKRYLWVRQRALSLDNSNNDHNNNNYNYKESYKDYLSLNEVNENRIKEILLLLSEVFDYEYDILKNIIRIIILVIPSNDICFHLCSNIISLKKNYWIPLNYNEHQLRLQIFHEVLKDYLLLQDYGIKYDDLIKYGILKDIFLNHIFLNFFLTLLPYGSVLRIMDMFLLEGSVILHRFGMGLIIHYLYLLKQDSEGDIPNRFRNGKAFWSEVARRSQSLEFNQLFYTTLQIGNKSFFRSLFTSTIDPKLEFHLTKESLGKYEERAKIALQSPRRRRSSTTSLTLPSLPSSLRIFNSLLYTSRYFSSTSLTLLFSRLPVSTLNSIDYFTLNFATYSHGYSLHSLYTLTSRFSPTLLILRSVESKVLIGVFIDDILTHSGRNSRGKGQGGIFRLDNDNCLWYETAIEKRRKKDQEKIESLSELSDDYKERKYEDKISNQVQEVVNEEQSNLDDNTGEIKDVYSPLSNAYHDILYQFCVCSHEAIIIGGSVTHGTNAIRICSDLKTCSCGPSDTYDNPSLAPEESDPFIIEDIEVFCGHVTVEDFVERHSI